MSHRRHREWRNYDELNRGDYRGDFGPEGHRYFDRPRDERHHPAGDDNRRGDRDHPGMDRADRRRDPPNRPPEPARQGYEGWWRGRLHGGFGSQYDAWRQGAGFAEAGFGFGPEERPHRGGFDDQDWQVTRPARGRGAWAGDWENEEAARRDAREDYRGRGPRGYRRSDDRIREDACERLTDDAAVDGSDIDVDVRDGEITLSGTVPSRLQKRRAEECVEDVAGAHDVINRLRVRDDVIERRGGEGQSGIAADRGRSR